MIESADVLLAAKRRRLLEAVGPIVVAFTANCRCFSTDIVRADPIRAGKG